MELGAALIQHAVLSDGHDEAQAEAALHRERILHDLVCCPHDRGSHFIQKEEVGRHQLPGDDYSLLQVGHQISGL